ncbi:hypothetical protein DE4587_01050 [Mycobacteroides salmoniphilum]|nr:hypothetical protein [Mycobacteroides salmoniphilum]TDZ81187.1 hypothetical protein DE4586_01134 [Mycobacteroides salmoniphilum]TDZ88687.1 hypothetical protein DE4587_01050 [Mycobacteroides salmoniphilum]
MRPYDYPLRVTVLVLVAGVLCFVGVNPGSVMAEAGSVSTVHALDEDGANASPAHEPQVDAFAQVVQIAKMCRGIPAGAMLLVLAFVVVFLLFAATRGSPVSQRIIARGGRMVLLRSCVNRC